jgi:hypothetical protein
MRISIALAAACAGLLAAAATLAVPAPARAQDWCGFYRKADARVRCGFSSLHECQEALTAKADKQKHKEKKDEPAVTCLPDPAFG